MDGGGFPCLESTWCPARGCEQSVPRGYSRLSTFTGFPLPGIPATGLISEGHAVCAGFCWGGGGVTQKIMPIKLNRPIGYLKEGKAY